VDEPKLDRRQFVGAPVAAPALGAMLLLPAAEGNPPGCEDFNVRRFGAAGDGKTKDTGAIQSAIFECHRRGGGTVLFPPGNYISGSLHLNSGIRIHLDHGATLSFSPDPSDFDAYEKLGFKNAADRETSYFHQALIWAEDAEHIAITGSGTIDGNRKRRGGPKPLAFKRCKFVTVKGITIQNSPNYCISLLGTDYVNIDGVTILNGYSDGIDPDCCQYVRIANCHIESWDDAIVPKTSFSLGTRRATQHMAVTNCVLASNCNCFKLGTESGGDFRNIAVSNCTMFSRSSTRPPISGISLLTVDGATIEGVTINNIAMNDVRCPVFLRLGNRGRDMEKPVPGLLRDVVISNIVATGARWPSVVAGIPDRPVERVTLADFRIVCKGGGTHEEGNISVPEHIDKYPTADMFGTYPSYGLFCRHGRDLRFSAIDFRYEEADARPAVLCDDINRLTIDSLETPGGDPVLFFRNVRNATVRSCHSPFGTKTFLSVGGAESRSIGLLSNDLSGAIKAVQIEDGAAADSVSEVGNRK
jgi:hypothetical protein